MNNNSAGDFDKDFDKVKKVIRALKMRCENAISNNDTKQQMQKHINTLINEWSNEVSYCEENRIKMVYYENDRSSQNLLCNFDQESGSWKTLQSMRNVENSALLKLIPGLKKNE